MRPLRPAVATLICFAAALLFGSSVAEAHTGHGASGFSHGAIHPLTGIDHLLAMICVGIWSTRAARPGRWWMLPAVFVGFLLIGLTLGVGGVPFPGVEFGIKASVLMIGLVLMIGWRLPLPYAIAATALFALCHGHAHGAEMPTDASGLTFGLGMMLSTTGLHFAGVGAGALLRSDRTLPILRLGGAAVACVGGLLLAGVI